jgi:hypothetical protein
VREDTPLDAIDPTSPRAPVRVPRPRPGPVTLAALLLGAESALGLFSAGALFLAARTVPETFRDRALSTVTAAGFTGTDVDTIASAIQTILITAGAVTFLLAVAGLMLARPVARGNALARGAAFVLAAAALCGGLGSMTYTAFGQHVDWAGDVGNQSEGLAAQVGQAYGEAMPGWLVGATGGLTDLQALGYIAVSIFLALPVARPYFRTRSLPAGPRA